MTTLDGRTLPTTELVNAPDMSLGVAEALLHGVRTAAQNRGVALAAVVVDRGGNLVAAARMDNAQLGAVSLAQDKAVTAVSFGHPTSAWTESSAPGPVRTSAPALLTQASAPPRAPRTALPSAVTDAWSARARRELRWW